MKKILGTFDLILDTVSAEHPLEPLLYSLKAHGVLVLVGAPAKPAAVNAFGLIMGNKVIAGSGIGGIKETQEMLDFSAEHGIVADIELITIDRVAEAYERTEKADVKYRFVIDVSSIKK
jgi:D-arabinose 1-dehydrogenase-like Zn-dependent alcohol dehydrogenase